MENLDDVVAEVGGVAGDDGLEIAKENGHEGVDALEAEDAASLVFLWQAGRCPFDELGEDWPEGRVVELVDHLNGDVIDNAFDLGDFLLFEIILRLGPLPAKVEGIEEDGRENWRIFGDNGFGVLVNGSAQNVEILAESLNALAMM